MEISIPLVILASAISSAFTTGLFVQRIISNLKNTMTQHEMRLRELEDLNKYFYDKFVTRDVFNITKDACQNNVCSMFKTIQSDLKMVKETLLLKEKRNGN